MSKEYTRPIEVVRIMESRFPYSRQIRYDVSEDDYGQTNNVVMTVGDPPLLRNAVSYPSMVEATPAKYGPAFPVWGEDLDPSEYRIEVFETGPGPGDGVEVAQEILERATYEPNTTTPEELAEPLIEWVENVIVAGRILSGAKSIETDSEGV